MIPSVIEYYYGLKGWRSYNRLSIIQYFTSTCISLYWVSGHQPGMAPNKHIIIKDNLCLITCNKKLLNDVRSGIQTHAHICRPESIKRGKSDQGL